MFNQDMTETYAKVQKQLVNTGFKAAAVEAAVNSNDLYLFQRRAQIELHQCSSCKLNCPIKVPGVGSQTSPLMIIGEGPGEIELNTGIPFMGPAGTALIIMLNALGIYRGAVYMTNATHCNKIDPNTNKYMTPGPKEIDNCRLHLLREIQIVQPKVILALGNPALWSLTMDYNKKISQMRGKIEQLHPDIGVDARIIYSWHPSYMIRQSGDEFYKVKEELWHDVSIAYEMVKRMVPNYAFDKRPQW